MLLLGSLSKQVLEVYVNKLPPLSKRSHTRPFCFYRRPTFVPVLKTKRNAKGTFHHYEMKAQSENSVWHLLCREPLQKQNAAHVARVAPPRSPPSTALGISASSNHSSELWVSLCALSLFILCIPAFTMCKSHFRFNVTWYDL